jgi:hypothetical protein
MNDERGKKLLDGVFNGQTLFPDENYRKIVKAAYLSGSDPQQSYELAIEAYRATGSPTALNYLLNSGRTEELESKVYEFCKSIVSDFVANEEKYKNEDGFAEIQSNVIMALSYIGKSAPEREPQKASTYSMFAQQLVAARTDIMKEYNW